ncbi:hypothetical protein pVco5_127 [Vibrio phage pVco-5]|uniref:Uncharacterized protein n=1 Tax=Vibrio phage pVco-5 TaxID=1965485 RepID=A0A1W6JUV1_9CAUD|nr:hypothetical protein KNT61_gp075 [Vibrio phage pVco-5]ARM71063.1 hypothetical protein pVco5_127 [Vibrio phage pVco-5]
MTTPILVNGSDYRRVGDEIFLLPVGTQRIMDYIHDLEQCAY